jgi:hypothetical protein
VSTANAARAAIADADTAAAPTPTAPESSNAGSFADVAGAEYDHYVNNGMGDPSSLTRQAAAAAMTTLDARPFVSTKYGQVRRQHEDDGNPVRRAAREALDGHSWGEAVKAELSDKQKAALASDKAKLAANTFASEINASTMEKTLPTNASTDAIVNAIIARRNAK